MEPITRSEMLMDGQYVEPKTRKEMILAGDDLEPITREEYFLKKYRHSGGDVDVVQLTATENKTYTAPRRKAYNPVKVNVPEKKLTTLNANENKTYSPPSGYDGFSEVTVYVPYVTQGTTINENGTYTPPSGVDGFGRVIVDVPTPPPSLQSLTASHNGYFLPSSGYVGFSEVNVDVALPQNAYLLESQKDDVVTIQHGAEFDMPKLIVSIEPQQDLHGYDAPWVGGAGKNKIPMTVDGIKNANSPSSSWSEKSRLLNGVTFTILTDESENVIGIKAHGQATETTSLYISKTLSLPNGSYTLNGCPSNGSVSSYGVFADYSSGGNTPSYGTDASVSINNVTLDIRIRIASGYNCNNLVFTPMIRLASVTDSTFAPYSNECPISGWTACNVVRTGENLFDKATITENKIINNTTGEETVSYGRFSSDYIKVNPSTDYYASNVIKSAQWYCVFYYDKNKNYLSCGDLSSTGDTASGVVTTPSGCNYARLVGVTTYKDDVSFVVGNQAPSSYSAYSGNTYTINFVDGSSPLTVYKGEFDVLSGLLKAYPHYDSYNGETINGEWISDRDAYSVGATPTIGAEVQVISGSDYTTYQQTANNVKSLEGVNNLWADTGEVDVQIWTKEV